MVVEVPVDDEDEVDVDELVEVVDVEVVLVVVVSVRQQTLVCTLLPGLSTASQSPDFSRDVE